MLMPRCVQCKFWNPNQGNMPQWGECKRNAPLPMTTSKNVGSIGPWNMRGIWPYTMDTDGCFQGEFLKGYRVQVNAPGPEAAGSERPSFDELVRQAKRS